MQKPLPQNLPSLQDISSRDGVRGAVRNIYDFLQKFLRRDQDFKESVVNELNPLYGELPYTPGALSGGSMTTVQIDVASALLGYTCDVSYDKDLQGLQKTAYVVNDHVKVVLKNDTGGSITLAAGKFRAYVWPRTLSS